METVSLYAVDSAQGPHLVANAFKNSIKGNTWKTLAPKKFVRQNANVFYCKIYLRRFVGDLSHRTRQSGFIESLTLLSLPHGVYTLVRRGS